MGIAAGILLGGILQIVIQIPSLLKHGFRLRYLTIIKKYQGLVVHPGIKEIGRFN